MASVLGLPRLKGTSHSIVSCEYTADFVPMSGQAVSVVDGSIFPRVVPFNGLFYGIVSETFIQPKHCSVVRSGLSVAVIQLPNVTINPILPPYFDLETGLLTDETGVQVTARLVLTDYDVTNPKSGVVYPNAGALIDFDQAESIVKQPIPPDFNKPDFLIGDFA